MEAEYQLTFQDIEAFARYHQKHGPGPKPVWTPGRIVGTVIIPLMLYYLARPMIHRLPKGILEARHPALLGFLVGSALTLGVMWWSRRRAIQEAKRRYEKEEMPLVSAPRRVRITPDGISVTSEFHQETNRWPGVWGIGVTGDYAFVYTTPTHAHVVPARAFADPRAFRAFVDKAREYLDGCEEGRAKSATILDALPASSPAITRKGPP